MKHIKQLDISENTAWHPKWLGEDISSDVDGLYNDINIMHLLIDEGYINSDGTGKTNYEDANAYLREEGLCSTDYFKKAEWDTLPKMFVKVVSDFAKKFPS